MHNNLRLLLLLSLILACPYSHAESTIIKKEITHLLDYIQHSKCLFFRNNKQHSDFEARKHTQRKFYYHRNKISSTEQFIELAATKSSITGALYLVSCNNNFPAQPVSGWLKKELNDYRKIRQQTVKII